MGGASAARSEEDASALHSAAQAVVRAVADGDTEAVAAHAAATRPDPFLVAEMLCGRAPKAAIAFARAATTADTRRLAAYVTERLKTPPSASELAELVAAYGERAAGDWSSLRTRTPGPEATVSSIAISTWRAQALRTQRENDSAASAYLDTGRRARRLGWLKLAKQALQQGAGASEAALRYDDMVAAFGAIAEIEAVRERPGSAAEAVFLLGSVHSLVGQYQTALRHLAKAREAFRALDLDEHVARVLNGEAVAYLGLGEQARALVLVERARALSNSSRRQLETLATLGRVHDFIGEYTEAAEAFRGALALARALKDTFQISQQLGNVGVALTYAGDYKGAATAYAEALAACEALKHLPSIATALMNLGYLALRQGEPSKALPLCLRALKLAAESGSARLLASAQQNLAQTLQRLLRLGDASAAFQKSIDHAATAGARRLVLEGHFGLAECHLAQGNPKEALAAAEIAIAQLGAMVGGLAEGQDARARSQHAAVFAVAAEAAARLDDPAALARVIEASRAMALLESLEGRAELRRLSIPDAFRKDEAAARAAASQARTTYQSARARRRPRSEVRKHRDTWKAAEARLEAVIGRMRRAVKHQVALVYPKADDLTALKGHLTPNDAFVLYARTPERYVALVIEKKGERIVTLGTRTEVDSACEMLAKATSDADKSAKAELAALQALAVDRLKLGKKPKRLLVSPAGRLFLSPLAAMAGAHTVTYVPSGTTYGVLLGSATTRGSSVLALGGVDYSKHPRLQELGSSGPEAENAGDTDLVGKDATEVMLRRTLKTKARWRALHLACHGLIDTDHPMRSALALGKVGEDDGLLSVLDIFAMKVPADLVVLSACESGRGRVYDGEGIVGLTRAFMYADAPRVICSLWRVDDAATAALMKRFYELWNPKTGKGVSAAAALKAAQEHVSKQPKWKAPYYWAAWVLWGLPE